jgi:hypothetical protein
MTKELFRELADFISKKSKRKGRNSRERYHWKILDTKIDRNLKYNGYSEECFCRFAYESAKLLNNLDLYGRKLVINRKVVRGEIKKRKLPIQFHNALLLMTSKDNEDLKKYFKLIGQ